MDLNVVLMKETVGDEMLMPDSCSVSRRSIHSRIVAKHSVLKIVQHKKGLAKRPQRGLSFQRTGLQMKEGNLGKIDQLKIVKQGWFGLKSAACLLLPYPLQNLTPDSATFFLT